jgi:Ca2+/Na+ antiporter
MNRCAYPAKVLVVGLFAAQVLATVQVYLSNAHLYRALVAIKEAGFLAIPNQQTMQNLQEFGPAFFGGLFFTLSVGAGLSLLTLTAAWLWDRLASRRKLILMLYFLAWMGCLFAVNRRGLCPMVSSYFLVLPLLVFLALLRWMPSQARRGAWLNRIVLFSPVVALALLWTPEMNRNLFVDLRDNLLLSNQIGRKINDFYYAYTLYPAEVFKSLHQKILRTCTLEGIREVATFRSLERKLISYDYLPVAGNVAVDLKIVQDNNTLVFENRDRTILWTTPEEFFANPGAALREFSSKSDRHRFFRHFTFFSLLIGFPLCLYLILYASVHLVFSFFLDARNSSVIASILCFAIGITVLALFHQSRLTEIQLTDVVQALESERWRERVAALKIIQEKSMEIADYQAYQSIVKSPHIPERYWLAGTLGVSRQPETYKDLLALLDDPHPNVVCMAFYALGQRRDSRAIKEILDRIETSDDWYNQWYAYKALRSLGWKQTESRPEP